MSKEVKTRASLDASRFTRGVNSMKKGIKALEKGLTIDFAKAMRIGKTGLLAVGAAGAAVGTGLAIGLNKVIQYGSELDHMSSQTGVAVKDLMVLRQVFEDNGVSSDNARLSLNKMQKLLFEAGRGGKIATESLAMLGLSVQDLNGLSGMEQFRLIGQQITAIEDPIKRSGAAMAIFGRSGAEMLSVFGGTKIDDAAANIGKQAELMEKNSALFERVGTLMGRAGNKLQGFFVGIADKVVPLILPLLERLDGLDLAGQGERFGNALAEGMRTVIGLFQSGNLLAVIRDTFLIAGAEFLNTQAQGWTAVALGFWGAFRVGWDSVWTLISSGFAMIGQSFAAIVTEAIAAAFSYIPGLKNEAVTLRRTVADLDAAAAKNYVKAAGSFTGIGDRMADSFDKAVDKASAVQLFDTAGMRANRSQMVQEALASVPAMPKSAAALIKSKPLTPFFDDELGASGSSKGGVSSLAAIGGGGGVAMSGIESLVDRTKEGNSILNHIDKGIHTMSEQLGKMTGGGAMVLA